MTVTAGEAVAVGAVEVGEGVGNGSGGANEAAGRRSTARSMNARQIRAGNEPPVTAIPRTFCIVRRSSGNPIHTTVERFGV